MDGWVLCVWTRVVKLCRAVKLPLSAARERGAATQHTHTHATGLSTPGERVCGNERMGEGLGDLVVDVDEVEVEARQNSVRIGLTFG